MESKRVKVKFYSDKRNSFPSSNYAYRPHFVVNGDNEMLGVEFIELKLNEHDQFGEAEVKLLYDNVGYFKLKRGISFNIVEGSNLVGEGIVLD